MRPGPRVALSMAGCVLNPGISYTHLSLCLGRFCHVQTDRGDVELFMQDLAGSAGQEGTEMDSDADRGFLIPEGYHDLRNIETPDARHIASVIWGATLVCACFCLGKVVRQSMAAHRRHRLRNTYIYLIWVTWISTAASSVIVWLWLLFFLPTRSVRRGNSTSLQRDDNPGQG